MKLPYNPGNQVGLVSPYGYRIDPITGAEKSWHAGIDLVSYGDKTICAVTSGTVIRSRIVTEPNDLTSEWGNYVCVQTDDGKYCYYCHMAKRCVTVGSYVLAGDPIGMEGSTGRSTGSHCHFEVREADNRTTIDPAEYLGIPNAVGMYWIDSIGAWSKPAVPEEPEAEKPAAKTQQDNTPDEYAREAVDWAVSHDILRGNQNGDYKLHSPVTRQDVLVFLFRAFAAQEAYYGEN